MLLASTTYIGTAAGSEIAAGTRTDKVVYSVSLPEASLISGAPLVPRGAILGCDLANFLTATLPGGSIEIFDASGTPARLAWRWGRTAAGGIAPVSIWGLFYRVRRRAAFSEIAWRHTGQEYRFTGPGRGVPLGDGDLREVNIDGVSFGTLRLAHGTAGVSLLPDSFGLVRITALNQNGSPPLGA
jgi:hypothetical protein